MSASIHAGYKDDIGHTRLVLEQGVNTPDGSSIAVTQTESSTSPDNNPPFYLPDWNDPQFSGMTISDQSGLASGTFSAHATSVGKTFYGNTSSITPGIRVVDAFWSNHWLFSGFLSPGGDARPFISASRIANHSWIGNFGAAINSDLLRRADWLVERDEYIQCAGITNNASANQSVMSGAYNVIAVGKSDGLNGFGTAALDAEYVSGRTRPELVAPRSSSSGATPVVAASATLLVEYAHTNTGLSTDPLVVSTSNRNGDTIYNAERSEVVKAILMAGADRSTANTNAADITDYRVDPANQTSNGLDLRFGAGQVNVYNSFHILKSGEQNSSEDAGAGNIGTEGFDYDPSFGGSGSSNATASYYFSTAANQALLSATLAWNINIDGGAGPGFSASAELYDIDLHLYDITGAPVLLASSTSTIDNTETLWTTLAASRDYLLQVVPKPGQGTFDWDYALAWQMTDVIIDTDGDGIPDSSDEDDDNDGMPDNWEISNNLDPLDGSDASKDTDADGLTNFQEYEAGSIPGNPDTDNDGLTDGAEVNTHDTNPLKADTDQDGVDDGRDAFPLDPSRFVFDLEGVVKTTDGRDICAMVLASGQYLFSCEPMGEFLLEGLPREMDGTVKLQIYADGFFPYIVDLDQYGFQDVAMTRSGTCPDYNQLPEPGYYPENAGMWVDISGQVQVGENGEPVCAMVLANGEHTFSCDGEANYALTVPLDTNGQVKLQVYADGFAPAILYFDGFNSESIVEMARAVECQ